MKKQVLIKNSGSHDPINRLGFFMIRVNFAVGPLQKKFQILNCLSSHQLWWGRRVVCHQLKNRNWHRCGLYCFELACKCKYCWTQNGTLRYPMESATDDTELALNIGKHLLCKNSHEPISDRTSNARSLIQSVNESIMVTKVIKYLLPFSFST